MLMLFALALAAPQASFTADTTVQVQPGSRLEVERVEGAVTVRTWNKSAVQVRAPGGRDAQLRVEVSGRRVTVEVEDEDHDPYDGDLELTVPADMSLSITSQDGDIEVTGAKAELDLETISGSITVEGGSGVITLHSTDGELRLTGAKGRIELNAVDGSITGRDLEGDIRAESVDGSVTLENVTASGVEATTVDGSIEFSGTLQKGGRYRLGSHDGNVTLAVPALDACVSVSTFSGSFESDPAFPVTLTGTRGGKRMSFTVGNCSASVDLESFDGAIRIVRQGSIRR
ncbi:MAG TPA: DUF4097 family beta strand repeat-containing protein [Gemmatimonadales bacterium]|nr:DUF4097 family beta strand repeat-containing protein [Gemmatimonadales bacterium]